MKLISYRTGNKVSFGALKGASVVDLARHFPDCADLKGLLALDRASGIDAAAQIVAGTTGDIELGAVELLPPIPNPGTIWCAGMNTHSHFEEAKVHMGLKEKPAKPILFMRSTSTLVASGQNLEKPKLERMFDYEGEIALVIGKRGRNIPVKDAMEYIAGYSCFNDASARDYQRHSPQITAGKNAYRSGGFGPWLSTADEVDAAAMVMVCRVDGQEVQRMPVDDLIFGFAELVSYISEFTWLEAGDVVVTGSPVGIGALRKPPVLLVEGTKVEVEVSGVGLLTNGVYEQRLP